MITGITIENFKGIRESLRLDFRPITLLFGANSAGKSTILHALHYAREVFERHNLSPDRTICGGSSVDLGGYLNIVHAHDRDRKVRMSITLDIDATDLDELSFRGIADSESSINEFCRQIEEIEVTFVVGWNTDLDLPFVSRYEVAINKQFLAAISTEIGRPESVLRFDSKHPVFLSCWEQPTSACHPFSSHPFTADELDANETLVGGLWDWFAQSEWIEGTIPSADGQDIEVYLDQRHDAFPDPYAVLPLRTVVGFNEFVVKNPTDEFDETGHAIESVIRLLTRLIVGPAILAKSALTTFRYLGPIRSTPIRNYVPPQYPDDSQWASGLGAWDSLHRGSDDFLTEVSDWLGSVHNLNSGCRIERRTFLELDLADPLVRKLIDRRAFDDVDDDERIDLSKVPITSRIVVVPNDSDIELRPHDVGAGIAQVVPVIVTALDGDKRLLAIEQPELHIHPRLQAAIADLFIEAIHKNKHRFIIETHSEHLILRLLRRIRETEKGKAPPDRQLRTNDLAIYYLKQEDGCSVAQRIDVDVKGEFIQPWPDDFFEIDFFERFPDAR